MVRSDVAFITKVLASVRSWREYHASISRLYAMEADARRAKQKAEGKPYRSPIFLTPVLEWWRENYALICDHLVRRYPIHMVAYESVLEDPARYIPEALDWLGVGDVDAALEKVDSSVRTQRGDPDQAEPELPAAVAAVFDELYRRVRDRVPFEREFVETLNATQQQLAPRISKELRAVREHEAQRRRAARTSDS